MKAKARSAPKPILVWSVLALLGGLIFSGTASAQVGSIIQVTTAVDSTSADGFCSLREAIIASNTNSNADGSASGCAGTGIDSIRFSLGSGTPTISLLTALPDITDRVTISGNTGGATRVLLQELDFVPPIAAGLHVTSTAANSNLRFLWLRTFNTGFWLQGAGSVLTSSWIGENEYGVYIDAQDVQVGGTTGTTPGGECTGDCNVIYSNGTGIMVKSGTNVQIQGNHIGTGSSGLTALGNGAGIRIEFGSVTIGGTTAASRNIISDNSNGIEFAILVNGAGSSIIQGNRIGTDTLGTSALGNEVGINVNLNGKSYPVTIGGSAAGSGNLISGNSSGGIFLYATDGVTIQGNRIGTQDDGTTPLPNGGPGVELSSSTHSNVIGGIAAGEANVIANNATGIMISSSNYYNEIRGNSISNNTGKGIQLEDLQNGTGIAPQILSVTPVSGTSCSGCAIDVFSDAADEGATYHGTTVAGPLGDWTYGGPVTGPFITATATSSLKSTSEFSTAFPLPDTDGDGVLDQYDNCTLVANASQCDSDGDGFGNHCDVDLNNNGFGNSQDYVLFRQQIGQPSTAPQYNQADFNCNGFVNSQDYILFLNRIGQPSGPSGLVP
jgi:CSLREA domain-containing protein